jgi:rare lipoprotein A
MRKILIGCGVVAVMALSASSEARPSDTLAFAKYFSQLETKASPKIGVASWYGEEFDGIPTASGELYDMKELTAASPDLPMGTRVKVTNLHNNRSLILRVNDRGPSLAGRLLDVSKAAAWHLGFLKAGLALVRIMVVSYPKGNRKDTDAHALQGLALNSN